MAQIGSAQQPTDGIGTDHPLGDATDLSGPPVQSLGTFERIEYTEPSRAESVHGSRVSSATRGAAMA